MFAYVSSESEPGFAGGIVLALSNSARTGPPCPHGAERLAGERRPHRAVPQRIPVAHRAIGIECRFAGGGLRGRVLRSGARHNRRRFGRSHGGRALRFNRRTCPFPNVGEREDRSLVGHRARGAARRRLGQSSGIGGDVDCLSIRIDSRVAKPVLRLKETRDMPRRRLAVGASKEPRTRIRASVSSPTAPDPSLESLLPFD